MTLRDEIVGLRRDLADISIRSQESPTGGAPLRTAVGSDLQGLEAKISEVLKAIDALAQRSGFDAAEVATASLQNPVPNAVAVRSLHDAMEQDADAGRRETHQGWLLTSMAEVVRRLGSPHNILPEAGSGTSRQRWEYFVDEDRAVIVTFENGLVTSLDN